MRGLTQEDRLLFEYYIAVIVTYDCDTKRKPDTYAPSSAAVLHWEEFDEVEREES